MAYSASYALHAAGQPAAVVDHALSVRAAVDNYYRGRVPKAAADSAVSGIQQETWFSQVLLPGGGRLPDDPTHTQWYATMDYDPLATIARIKVPMLFFFAEDDAYVPVPESMTRFREVARTTDVTILRISGTNHFMDTGKPAYAGPTSPVYIHDLVDWLTKHETLDVGR